MISIICLGLVTSLLGPSAGLTSSAATAAAEMNPAAVVASVDFNQLTNAMPVAEAQPAGDLNDTADTSDEPIVDERVGVEETQ